MIEISIMGQRYTVPQNLTILRAFEWCGYKVVRGVGCRGGFCGACSTVYRLPNDHRLYYALACQTIIKPKMILSQIPFFPARRADYQLDHISPEQEILIRFYPEILRCYGCNTCTKACPQELDVLSYMASAVRGDLESLANQSFDCIMCGLCVARCPAELIPPNVALLARRLFGKYLAPRAEHLKIRIQEIETGKFDQELSDLKSISTAELKKLYEAREIEL